MEEYKIYRLDEDGEEAISLCKYDPKACHTMSKSILSEDGTHFVCANPACRATK